INTMLLELLELRFQNSMSSALDVLQQREMVAKSRARIPVLELREASLLNAISLLCGRPSPKEISINTSNLNDLPSMPAMGIPGDLLSNRPDIKSAGFRLSSSRWATFQAMTDRLPSLNLTGSFLFQHTSLDAILKNWVVALASRLGGTFFDGGKNKAAIDLASAVVDERLAAYEKTVFTAILEVENAIAAEKYRTRWIDLMKAELNAANLALEEARNRYNNGMDTFIPVVTEQLNVQNLQMSLLEQKAVLFKDRIALHRAVGGRWTEDIKSINNNMKNE
ncbi:MAG: TolC family protein, partial [Desulfamplus sp.]|nr:TolC family protein [Desulfamplus sp.]